MDSSTNSRNMGRWIRCRFMAHRRTAMVWCSSDSKRTRRKPSASPRESCSLACLSRLQPGVVQVSDYGDYSTRLNSQNVSGCQVLHVKPNWSDWNTLLSLRNGEWERLQAFRWAPWRVPPQGYTDAVYWEPWKDHQLSAAPWHFPALWRNCCKFPHSFMLSQPVPRYRKHSCHFCFFLFKDIDIKKVNGIPQYAFVQYSDIGSVCKAIKKMDAEYLGNNRLKVIILSLVKSVSIYLRV